MRHGVEQNHAQENQPDADNAHQIGFLPEKHDAHCRSQHQPETRPNRVCCAKRHGFEGKRQKVKRHDKSDRHAYGGHGFGKAVAEFEHG